MKIIIASLILLSSLLLSGILVMFGVTEMTGIGFTPWFLISMISSYLMFKAKFKTEKRFRYFFLKNYVTINSFFKKVDNKIKYESEENKISPMQEKAVRLWKLCLRDKETNISCSISNRTRQIEKTNMLIILSPLNQLDYLMTILDIDDKNKSCLYEIRIGPKMAEGVISSFDNENERRMREGEEERRNSIYNDLDKLLQQEEQALKPVSELN
jgi:hypothetical protein